MDLHSGKLLHSGKYLLGDVLGAVGMSTTHRALWIQRNQPVVIKSLNPFVLGAGAPPQLPDFAALKQQFLSDAQRFSQCHHPGLVKILDIFEEGDRPYVVMDFVAGQTLAERVQTKGPLPEAKALQYIRQVASAVNVLHKQGWVHLDIRPQSMVRPPSADFVVLTDFGFAQASLSQLARHFTAELTTSQPMVDYIAPEQYSGQHLAPAGGQVGGQVGGQAGGQAGGQHRGATPFTAATDIYALAASLYHLVTGQPPLAAPLRNRSALVSPRRLPPQLSQIVETAIFRGMDINPQVRPQTLAAWFALLMPNPTPAPAAVPVVSPPSVASPPQPGTAQVPVTQPPKPGPPSRSPQPVLPAQLPVLGKAASPSHPSPSHPSPSHLSPSHPSPSHPLPKSPPPSLPTTTTKAQFLNSPPAAQAAMGGTALSGQGGARRNATIKPHQKPSIRQTGAPSSASSGGTILPSVPFTFYPGPVLMKIAAIAGLVGLTGGLVLRLSGGTGPGSQFFHTEQSFPAISDWQDSAPPKTPPIAPPVPKNASREPGRTKPVEPVVPQPTNGNEPPRESRDRQSPGKSVPSANPKSDAAPVAPVAPPPPAASQPAVKPSAAPIPQIEAAPALPLSQPNPPRPELAPPLAPPLPANPPKN